MDKINRINQHTNNLIGRNIKRIRLSKGLRNRDIIAKLQLKGIDISHSTYAKIEAGTNNPSVDFLLAIVEILECDFNTLFQINDD